MKIEHRLSTIGKANANDPNYINKGLYRLLYCEELYLMAYGMIRGNKGALTKGVDATTMDGFSRERIDKIINKLREESYQFKPCRRVYIPNMNGKLRPLGIPTADDKLVQSCMQIILNTLRLSNKAGV